MWKHAAAAMLCGTIAWSALAQDANEAVQGALPSPLLSIDQNRRTVVDRIVGQWGTQIEQSNAGLSAGQLREMLSALRADHLLAASLAGSLAGLRDVLATAANSTAPALTAKVSGKALGDANADLVYTPVPPCRLFDTRASQGGLGTLAPAGLRNYGATAPVSNQGGPGGCAAAAGAAVALIQIGTVSPSGSGLLQGGAQGAGSFPNALILYQSGDQYGTAVAMPLNAANGQFTIVAQFAATEAYGDLLGYFRPATGFSPPFGSFGLVGTVHVNLNNTIASQHLSNGQTATMGVSGTTGLYFISFPGFAPVGSNFSQTIQITTANMYLGASATTCGVNLPQTSGTTFVVAVECATTPTGAGVASGFYITVTL